MASSTASRLICIAEDGCLANDQADACAPVDVNVSQHSGACVCLVLQIWANNAFAGTAFSSYGGFWMGYGIYGILVAVCLGTLYVCEQQAPPCRS